MTIIKIIYIAQNNYNLKNYNDYNITLNNLIIENVSNLSSFCLIIYNSNNKELIILILLIDSDAVNLSIVSISQKLNDNNKYNCFQILGIDGFPLGEEDIIDDFILDCLSGFNKDILTSCLNSCESLNKLRKSCDYVIKCFNKNEMKLSKRK